MGTYSFASASAFLLTTLLFFSVCKAGTPCRPKLFDQTQYLVLISWNNWSDCTFSLCFRNCYQTRVGQFCLQEGGCTDVEQFIPCACASSILPCSTGAGADESDQSDQPPNSFIIYRSKKEKNAKQLKATTSPPTTPSVSPKRKRRVRITSPVAMTARTTLGQQILPPRPDAPSDLHVFSHAPLSAASNVMHNESAASDSDASLLIDIDSLQCGVSNEMNFRIGGGTDTGAHSWPWHVGLTMAQSLSDLRKTEVFCGGTLVHPRFVLTAAHCVNVKARKRYPNVLVGEHDRSSLSGRERLVTVKSEFTIKGYQTGSAALDIALLQLNEPVQQSEYVAFACLPKNEHEELLKAGNFCTVVGWGKKKNEDRFGSRVLQEAKVKLQNSQKCFKKYKFSYKEQMHLCAGSVVSTKDTCSGDSGGGLFCKVPYSPKAANGTSDTSNQETSRWILHGITTGGEKCGKGVLSVYQNVTFYNEWIRQTIINVSYLSSFANYNLSATSYSLPFINNDS